MQTNKLIFLGFILSLVQGAFAETGDVLSTQTSRSGRTVEKIEWEGTEKGFILITYPKELKPSQKYHLNFWFPGTSGNPGLGVADQNLNYIEICVSYLAEKNFQPGEFALKHWDFCREIEKYFLGRKEVVVGQRIVSGVSKGGWLAFDMSVEQPAGVDGVIIVAAGRSPREKRTLDFKHSTLSVLVCTGETDSNYPFAQMAESFYRKCGLDDYCYEEWLTKGHVSQVSERVVEWLNVQAKKEESPVALELYCDKVIRSRLAEGEKSDDPKAHYISLRHHLKSPAAAYVSEGLRSELLVKGRELAKDPAVAAWLLDFKTLRKITEADLKNYQTGRVTSEEAKKSKNYFLKLAQNTKHSDLKFRAAYGYLRKAKDEALLSLQEKEKATPAYQKAEQELKDLRDILNKQRPPAPELIEQFQNMSVELGRRNTKLSMDAFRKVEWDDEYVIEDAVIEKLLKEGSRALGEPSAYSGVSY